MNSVKHIANRYGNIQTSLIIVLQTKVFANQINFFFSKLNSVYTGYQVDIELIWVNNSVQYTNIRRNIIHSRNVPIICSVDKGT